MEQAVTMEGIHHDEIPSRYQARLRRSFAVAVGERRACAGVVPSRDGRQHGDHGGAHQREECAGRGAEHRADGQRRTLRGHGGCLRHPRTDGRKRRFVSRLRLRDHPAGQLQCGGNAQPEQHGAGQRCHPPRPHSAGGHCQYRPCQHRAVQQLGDLRHHEQCGVRRRQLI